MLRNGRMNTERFCSSNSRVSQREVVALGSCAWRYSGVFVHMAVPAAVSDMFLRVC